MRNRLAIATAVIVALAAAGCRQTPTRAVHLHRLERVMFSTPVEHLQDTLAARAAEFATPLLTLYPQDPAFMQQVEGFVTDPVIHRLYELVDSTFGDMRGESEALGEALARMREAYPAMRYDKVYTYISGTMDYSRRVVAGSHECLVSIDQYVLPYTAEFGYFGSPMYLVRQSHPRHLVADCIGEMARQYIAMPAPEPGATFKDPTILDYMVTEGKALYLASLCLPDVHDSILLRYSSEQYEWMERQEGHVWTFFLENNLLFQNDHVYIHNFVDEAPQTNAFRPGTGSTATASAPRTTEYIGLRIVRQYMKKSGASVQELFEETNSQKILDQSGYRPK